MKNKRHYLLKSYSKVNSIFIFLRVINQNKINLKNCSKNYRKHRRIRKRKYSFTMSLEMMMMILERSQKTVKERK
jgi:hypothetical protein